MNLLSQQNGPMPMPLLSIGTATDITNNKYTSTSNHVVRIAAITECRIWHYNPTSDYKQGTGLLLPIGSVIELPVFEGYVIDVVGSANICKFN